MERKTSTDRVRGFRARKKANKPPKKPPKTTLERNREYRARRKALKMLCGQPNLPTTSNTAETSTSIDRPISPSTKYTFLQNGHPEFEKPIFNNLLEQLMNVKFVEAVQTCPCLWDNKSKHYRNKEFVRDAWNKISQQFKETPETCRERWRNIRNAFLRSMKRYPDDTVVKKQYYLKAHLQFLLPFVKNKPTASNYSDAEDKAASESEEDIKPGAFLDESQHNDSVESFQNDMDPEHVPLHTPEHQIHNSLVDCSPKRQQQSDSEFGEQCAADGSQSNKRSKWCDNKEDVDPNLSFFKSLLRDVRQMNDRQNRKFRYRVMQIVDEILDEGQK